MDKICRYISAYLEEQNIPKISKLAKYTKMIYVETGKQRERMKVYRSKFTHGRRMSCRRVVQVERERQSVRERCSCADGHDAGRLSSTYGESERVREREREREREIVREMGSFLYI
jgi:hypothetical protein